MDIVTIDFCDYPRYKRREGRVIQLFLAARFKYGYDVSSSKTQNNRLIAGGLLFINHSANSGWKINTIANLYQILGNASVHVVEPRSSGNHSCLAVGFHIVRIEWHDDLTVGAACCRSITSSDNPVQDRFHLFILPDSQQKKPYWCISAGRRISDAFCFKCAQRKHHVPGSKTPVSRIPCMIQNCYVIIGEK